MKLYYVKCESGCGLRRHRSLKAAERAFLREIGTHHADAGYVVREATADEIGWVKGMHGRVPGEEGTE